MRTITDLVKNEPCVWLYLGSHALCLEFYKQAYEEGFRFGDLPYEKWAVGYVIGVHGDYSMGHVPIFIWHTSFTTGCQGMLRIDYEKYRAGEEDCICHTSHFTGGMVVGECNGQSNGHIINGTENTQNDVIPCKWQRIAQLSCMQAKTSVLSNFYDMLTNSYDLCGRVQEGQRAASS